MKKFSLKMMLAIMICSVVTATFLCGVSIQKSTSALQKETERTLTFASEKYANQFSSIFKNTEGMVDAVAANVAVSFDLNAHKSNPAYFQQYKADLSKIVEATITNSRSINGLYFTFSPELTEMDQEVWYAYAKDGKSITSIRADFGANKRDFSEPAAENMKYFFQPIHDKKGAWTGPYLDPDVLHNMISYSNAVYVDGILIGVAGADILTEDTIDIVETMKIYEGSYAFLLDQNFDFIVRSQEAEVPDFTKDSSEEISYVKGRMKAQNTGVVHLALGREESILAFSHLSNGWILGIAQPTAEVYSSINMITTILAGFTVLAIVATVVFAVIFSRRFSRPILNAADQLKQLGMGDYTQRIPPELRQRRDDIGEFAEAIASIQEAIEQEAGINREKDVLLIYQSKQAKIGEMVGNISHQWKQPLNNINLILLNLYDAYLYQEMDGEMLRESIEKVKRIVKSMSMTIEDFTDFLKPNKEKTMFDVTVTVDLALSLMEASIKYNGISVSVDLEEGLILYGFVNEFSHVLFNVLNNARDAIVESNIRNKEICIRGWRRNGSVILEVSNKGNRIQEELLPQVFDPYMTTKGDKEGTGIGLYISKLIIEQRMNGVITLENLEDGVCCRISVKCGQELVEND